MKAIQFWCLAVCACGPNSHSPDVFEDATSEVSDASEVDSSSRPPGLDVVLLMRESFDEARLRDRIIEHMQTALPRWFDAVPELRVAVLGTDLGLRHGAGRICSSRGSAAILRREVGGCGRSSYVIDASTPRAAGELACLMNVFGNCGIEQPLEAALAAFSTDSEEYRFFGESRTEGEVGLGDTLNADFRREGVPLLLVIPTMEDDCSFVSPDFFVGLDENFRVRCAEHPEELHSIESYVDAFDELSPAGVYLYLLVGLPVDLVESSPAVVLEDPRLQYAFDPMTVEPTISCDSESLGRAFPPSRLLRFASQLAEQDPRRVALGSMCDDATLTASFQRLDEFVFSIP